MAGSRSGRVLLDERVGQLAFRKLSDLPQSWGSSKGEVPQFGEKYTMEAMVKNRKALVIRCMMCPHGTTLFT